MDKFTLKYLLLVLLQILILSFCNFSQFLLLCFLPTMILLLDLRRGAVASMLIAFLTGLAVDFLSGSPLGLTAFALVPVGAFRFLVIRGAIGPDSIDHGDRISFARNGFKDMFVAILLVTAIFLFFYIVVDSAGTRPFWIDLVKFGVSLLVSSILSAFVARILDPETNTRWR